MSPFLKKIGQRLRSERKTQLLNQTAAAEKAGLSRREVGEIENAVFRGSILKVQDYAMSLGFSLTLEIKRRPSLAELSEIFDEV